MSANSAQPHRIVVVGGGAGGLELVTGLGNRLGKRGRAEITLIDRARTHLWKPLLHQVAAGSMDLDDHELAYLAQARWHGFRYRMGALEGLDREAREVIVGPSFDETGKELVPRRRFPYDTLIIAIGSVANDFGTPGVAEHAIALDTKDDAARFNRRLVNACIRASTQEGPVRPGQLHVAIIGAGATGVELAAELHKTTRQLAAYGLDRIDPDKDIRLCVVDAAERILPALPRRLSAAAAELLDKLNVSVHAGERVTEVTPEGVHMASGEFLPAEITVWAAGIKGPDCLAGLDGLEVNRANQLVVGPTLQTTRDPDVFAFGDCADCPWQGHDASVPPRAQAAHQQASLLVKSMKRRLRGQPLAVFRYRDFGSLVSLGEYSTVGSLMGFVTRGSLMIEGYFARLMYLSLYKMHLLALHGYVKVGLSTLARIITRRTEPHVKLH